MCLCECKELAGVEYPLDRYDLDVYTVPYWSGDIMYHESVMVLEDKDGNVPDRFAVQCAEDPLRPVQ